MIAFINEFSDMPDWYRKSFDPDTVFEWKNAKLLGNPDITGTMVDRVSCELLSDKSMNYFSVSTSTWSTSGTTFYHP